ncbi:SWIM zinc finger family protein [Larkinella punicea]|uniref:SWIM-type domain-containing protein n=1 Tax=Larkinella punicea TaxID=2315727 RepID=A0A368JUW6_9BACT|nr:hypothetical protein [Larkinella punicea]RCR71459.1 hypothetical protein DUE52_00540 [Larkinella punicea]
MFTKNALRQLAGSTVFGRGEDYYRQGAVKKLKQRGNTFEAIVYGSDRYNVSLTLRGKEFDVECDCPYGYEYEGICKHCVALGLAVLDQFGTKQLAAEAVSSTDSLPPVHLDTLWQQTTVEQKTAFLRQLLDKQPDLRAQLAQFVGLKNNPVPSTEPASVEAVSTEVFEALSDLRFDDETLEMDDDDYYSEENPDPEPLIEDVLRPYAEQVGTAFRQGRLLDAMRIYLGVYEGTQAAFEPAHDEYSSIEDYPSQSLKVWHRLLEPDYQRLSQQVISSEDVRWAMNQLGERVHFFDEAENNDEELYYDLKAFEPLMLALSTDRVMAAEVRRAIENFHWERMGVEYVLLRIADTTGDTVLWVKTAEQFSERDALIGLQLLQHHHRSGDHPALINALLRLTKRFPGTFDAFILENLNDPLLTPGDALNLYLQALENRSRSQGSLADYQKLRTFWSEDQRNRFVDSLKSKSGMVHNQLFYAQVLQVENRPAELLKLVKNADWLYVQGMNTILTLTAKFYPNECMDLVMERSAQYLDNGQRGRATYVSIASWLTALNGFQSLKPQVAIYAEHLYKTYSRLNALREELRNGGLVRGK